MRVNAATARTAQRTHYLLMDAVSQVLGWTALTNLGALPPQLRSGSAIGLTEPSRPLKETGQGRERPKARADSRRGWRQLIMAQLLVARLVKVKETRLCPSLR